MAQVTWNNANGGNFSTGSNWVGGATPNSTQTANFTNFDSAYAVTFDRAVGTSTLNVDNGDLTFILNGNTYDIDGDLVVGRSTTLTGDLTLVDGTMNARGMHIGGSNGTGRHGGLSVVSGGRVILNGSAANTVSGTNSIGSSLNVFSGGQFFQEQGSLNLALTNGSIGKVDVSGLGSYARLSTVQVGSNGVGIFLIRNSAISETTGLFTLATNAGSSGTLNVRSNGTWNHYGGAILLGQGSGSISIERGLAHIQGISSITAGANDQIEIGVGGILRMDGPESSILLNSGASLFVDAAGTLEVTGSGTFSGINLGSGATLTQNGGTILIANFTRQGTLALNAGSFSVDGGVFDNSSASLSLGGIDSTSINLVNGASTTGITGLIVGTSNTSFAREFNVLAGSTLNSTSGLIGQMGTGSLVRVNGPDSTWNSTGGISIGQATGNLIVENGGRVSLGTNVLHTGVLGTGSNGIVTIQSGGQLDAGNVELSRVAGSVSTTTVTGSGSELNAAGLFIGGSTTGAGGTANLTIADNAAVTVGGTTRVRAAGTLNLNSGNLTTQNFIRDSTGIFNFGGGTMNVLGTYSNTSGTVTLAGSGVNDNPTLVLEGNASTSGITNLNVGSSTRMGTLTLNPGSQLTTGVATIASRGTVNLDGGNLLVSSITNNGTLNWNRGAVNYTGSSTLDSTTLTGLLGSAHNLRDNQTLGSIGGTMTLGSALNVNGGTLSPTNLTNNSTLTLNQGNVQVAGTFDNNAGRTVQINGVSDLSAINALNNSGTIRMNSPTASMSSNQLTNNAGGTISGTGQINGDLDNFGILRASLAEHLVLTGLNNRNIMNMNLSGGTFEFTESLFNRSGAAITGRGTFVGSSNNPGGLGLTNDGLMSFSAGTMDIFGDVDQTSGGRIVTSGGGVTTFFDDVIHNGEEIRTFLGSSTVFLGDQTGAGNFTGTGVVEYAGDLRPGNSPAVVTYEGDVRFNSLVHAFFELGADGFDQLLIAGNLELAGTLSVSLLENFSLSADEEFMIMQIDKDRIGQFSGLDEGSQVGRFNGRNLFITYEAGNGNDVALFTAVPEPSTAGLLAMVLVGGLMNRRRRRIN